MPNKPLRVFLVGALLATACTPRPDYPSAPYGFDIGKVIPDLTFQSADPSGAPTQVVLKTYYEPSASSSRLLILRVGAGWCGTCQWHLQHTGELLALDIAPALTIVDLLVADEDNAPATLDAIAPFRAAMDRPQAIAIDPGFQLAPTMSVPGPLPLLVVLDRRTMQIWSVLNDPDPDGLETELKSILKKLNKTVYAPAANTDGPDQLHRNQWDLLHAMTLPGAPPPDPTNAKGDDPSAAALGRSLFSDASLSPGGSVSCATCHDPARSFTDARAQSIGVSVGDRNAPSVLFAAHARWQFWDGRADSLWSQALGPMENPKEFNSSRLFVAHAIFDRYRSSYEAVFGVMPALSDTTRFPAAGKPGDPSWETMTVDDQRSVTRIYVNAGKSIAAFERTLRAKPNAFDAYVGGDTNALTTEQKASLREFLIGGCPQCHYGPRLTDDAFHVIRFPTGRQDGAADTGRKDGIGALLASEFVGTGEYSDAPAAARSFTGLTAGASTLGAFKTPPLRGVASTAPYGHGGSLPGLLDVAKAYGTAGLDPSDPKATGQSEVWLPTFTGGHAMQLVPLLDVLTADPAP